MCWRVFECGHARILEYKWPLSVVSRATDKCQIQKKPPLEERYSYFLEFVAKNLELSLYPTVIPIFNLYLSFNTCMFFVRLCVRACIGAQWW